MSVSDLPVNDQENTAEEIALKSSHWNSRTVNARLSDSFTGPEYAGAALLLAGLAPAPECSEQADETACRLMLAALRVSEGNLAKLQMWVDVARQDPRDLIVAAEYRGELELGTDEARASDLAKYLAWVTGAE